MSHSYPQYTSDDPTRPKCVSKDCSSPATFHVFWPDQPSVMCGPCTQRALNIADAMGFRLTTLPLLKPKQETNK